MSITPKRLEELMRGDLEKIEATPAERLTTIVLSGLELVRDKPEAFDSRRWAIAYHDAVAQLTAASVPGELLEAEPEFLIRYDPATMFAGEAGWTFFLDGELRTGTPIEWAAAKWLADHDSTGAFLPRERLPWQAWIFADLVERGFVEDTPEGLLGVTWYVSRGLMHPGFSVAGSAAWTVEAYRAAAVSEWLAKNGPTK